VLVGVIVASNNGQFLHIETELLEFLDSRFGKIRNRNRSGLGSLTLFISVCFSRIRDLDERRAKNPGNSSLFAKP
jgi:hypothetical protein